MSGTTKQGACRHNSWRGGNPSIVVAITKTTNRDPIATVGRACRNNEMKSTVPRPSRPHPRRRHVFYKTSSCGNTKLGLLVLCSEPLLAIFATFLALRVPGHFHAATAFRAHSWVTASTTGHHRRRHQVCPTCFGSCYCSIKARATLQFVTSSGCVGLAAPTISIIFHVKFRR